MSKKYWSWQKYLDQSKTVLGLKKDLIYKFSNSIFSVIDFGTTSHSKSDSTNGKPSPTTQKPVSSSKNQIHIYDETVDGSKNENSKNFYHQMTDKKATFSWSASATITTCHATILLLPMLIIISQFIAWLIETKKN